MDAALDAMRTAMKNKDPEKALAAINGCQQYLAEGEPKTLYNEVIAAARKADEKKLAAEKARKKKEGVRIGMTQQDVLDSSWGKPERVNVTTTNTHQREQWVYGLGNYLYFEDGILQSIQARK